MRDASQVVARRDGNRWNEPLPGFRVSDLPTYDTIKGHTQMPTTALIISSCGRWFRSAQFKCRTVNARVCVRTFKSLYPFQVLCFTTKLRKKWRWEENDKKNQKEYRKSLCSPFRGTCAKYIILYISYFEKKKEKRNETQLSSVGQVGSYMDYVFILCPLANALHTATAKSFIVIRPLVIAVLSNTFAG